MHNTLDLPAYLSRIGYRGDIAASLPVLRAIVLQHAQAISFENLSPFLGLPVSLELADVERKLVFQGRGGYCFEQNLLLGQALRQIGFEVTGLAARVLWMKPEDAQTARSHMLLAVDLDGVRRVVDVGFGGQTLTGVLELRPDALQATPHGDFRLLCGAGQWRMQSRTQGQWCTLYRYDLSPQYLIDYEVANYYVSTHPHSLFTQNLIAARPVPQGRLALQNRDYTFYPMEGQGEPQRRSLASGAEILAVLADDFGLDVAGLPGLAARLDTL
ncbi:arylamine N-acetyltransferase family protein [Candidimonas nitroreducens]|uniref:Arylamine N-acetyltransferase n=1 Tax=Candidimonas nitroreducens TaxID=683354 RepID=A0A225M5G1_9BURK|nr:arylamine N-acetyltransferase [Candidimonas nitroreducens]OWT54791.1 arylamine N-acetyltransferase [Candidimonas nitroreducens]